jgi:predicted RNA-binding Zn-ribbon protein involved in translation (DUF1610 family)
MLHRAVSKYARSIVPTLPCPSCGTLTAKLEESSRSAAVNYYRCDRTVCGHVWTVSKATGQIVMLRAAALIPNCPSCGQRTARHLAEVSRGALVNYFACPECAHVWNVSKRDPTLVTHVTPLKQN